MTATGSIRRRARRGQGDRLRDEIVTAATNLLAERGGEEAVSIRAIADAVGVTPPSIYLHFADKEELFLAVCDARFQELDRLSNLAVEGVVDPLERIRRRGDAYVRFGLDNPEHYRVLFMGPRHAAASTEQMKEWAAFEHLVEDVRAAIAQGLLGGEPFIAALGLWATVHGITSLMISMPTFPWPPLEQLMTACGAVPEPLPARARRAAVPKSAPARRVAVPKSAPARRVAVPKSAPARRGDGSAALPGARRRVRRG